MKKTLTILALILLCVNFSFATNGNEINTNNLSFKISLETENINQPINDRIYYWEVENAHGNASGFVYSIEKAQEMIKKVSKADYSRLVIIKSNPLK